jgi:hypothetical protein
MMDITWVTPQAVMQMEGPEDPAEVDVAAFRHEDRKRDRNGKIGNRDHRVGGDMKPDQLRFPQQANAVRGKRRRIE